MKHPPLHLGDDLAGVALVPLAVEMLRHGADMQTAIELRRSEKPTDEEREKYVAILVASFNAAQSAWDTYREHLSKHGLLTQ